MNCCGHDEQVVLDVKGMSCEHCEKAIEENVRELVGVRDVSADASGGEVKVVYDPDKVSLDDIIAAISEAGYEVEK